MPGGGDFVSFFRPGGQSFAMKSCPRGGDFDGKIVVRSQLGGGGMVTSQTDTCIIPVNKMTFYFQSDYHPVRCVQ